LNVEYPVPGLGNLGGVGGDERELAVDQRHLVGPAARPFPQLGPGRLAAPERGFALCRGHRPQGARSIAAAGPRGLWGSGRALGRWGRSSELLCAVAGGTRPARGSRPGRARARGGAGRARIARCIPLDGAACDYARSAAASGVRPAARRVLSVSGRAQPLLEHREQRLQRHCQSARRAGRQPLPPSRLQRRQLQPGRQQDPWSRVWPFGRDCCWRMAPPPPPAASAALLDPAARGTADLAFTAGDPGGPGVDNVAVQVDGRTLYSATPDAKRATEACGGGHPAPDARRGRRPARAWWTGRRRSCAEALIGSEATGRRCVDILRLE
jgi:hypothetical protein